jgi:hypothetical protein
MSLQALADLGSLINGLAVLASLVYLGLQVNHAVKAQRAAMHQARVDRATNMSLKFVGEDVPGILAKAASGANDFSSPEVLQLFHVLRIHVLALDDALWQADAGFLDLSSRDTTILAFRRLTANPIFRATWHILRPQIAPDLQARIETIIRETQLAPPQDWALAWKEAHAGVLAESGA